MVDIGEILNVCVSKLDPININGTDYPVQFFEGILSDAKEQMNTYKSNNEMPYPAIWLIRDFDENENVLTNDITALKLVLLIDTEGSYRAPERLENRINPYLQPLKNSILKELKKAGVFCGLPTVRKLTFLGNPNAGIASNNPTTNSKIFSDYLDGLQITFDVSYLITLNLDCYVNR